MIPKHVAIIGSGIAGWSTAAALRQLGFDGRIALISAEDHLPYQRPPLSKAVLTDETPDLDDVIIGKAADIDRLSLDWRPGMSVSRIEPRERRVSLASGAALRTDTIILATGSRARPLATDDMTSDVLLLRTIDDALAMRTRLRSAGSILIVGAGIIGMEVASSAAALGIDVTLIEAQPAPMTRMMGETASAALRDHYRAKGVTMIFDAEIRSISSNLVTLTDGRIFEANLVIAGVGAAPAIDLAVDADIDTGNGVIVDRQCRTSVPEIYAVGDIACQPRQFCAGPLRMESHINAQIQAEIAAAAILGQSHVSLLVPGFWSDQFGLNIQGIGLTGVGVDARWRTPFEGETGVQLFFQKGKLAGAIGINASREIARLRKLILRGCDANAAQLCDESTALESLTA